MSPADSPREGAAAAPLVRLRPGVRRVVRSGAVTLVSPDGTHVRVSPAIDEFWSLLVEGAPFEELAARLRERRPRASATDERLQAFLAQLHASRLLDDAPPAAPETRPRFTLDIDPLARRIVAGLVWIPRPLGRLLLVLAVAAACLSIGVLLTGPVRPRFIDLFAHFSVWGLTFVLAVAVPLHELGHAVAARAVGVRVAHAGLRGGFLGLPRPYVSTPDAALLAQRGQRLWIPAGGPLVDLLLCGVAAWVVLANGRSGTLGAAASFVFLYTLMNINIGTSPLQPGDGSHMLEALLDDDSAYRGALLGRPSRFSDPARLRWYRRVAVAHGLLTLVFLAWLR